MTDTSLRRMRYHGPGFWIEGRTGPTVVWEVKVWAPNDDDTADWSKKRDTWSVSWNVRDVTDPDEWVDLDAGFRDLADGERVVVLLDELHGTGQYDLVDLIEAVVAFPDGYEELPDHIDTVDGDGDEVDPV